MSEEEPFDEIMGGSTPDAARSSGPPAGAFSSTSAPPPSNAFGHHQSASSGLNHASPPADDRLNSSYEFRRSESDITGNPRPVRGYLWDDQGSEDVHRISSPAKIRDDALKVLDMVDGNLSNQFDVNRTGSLDMPYSVRRTVSGGDKKRIPAALSGLDFTGSTPRFSVRDPKYMDDLEELDKHAKEGIMADIPMGGSKPSWSSRYSLDSHRFPMSSGMSNQEILADMEREEQRQRMSARNMIADSAASLTSKISEGKSKVFGSGFSFRQNHVFGRQHPQGDALLGETNLRTAWQDHDISDGNVLPPPPPVHKTWQQSLLNKQRRRRICLLALGFIIVLVTLVVAMTGGKSVSMMSGTAPKGSEVTFYVTSDVPESLSGLQTMVATLRNLPDDADFVVHLGNIQTSETCPGPRYSDVAFMLSKSSAPMFVLPGSRDWVTCPDPEESLKLWQSSFGEFETNFDHDLEVNRQRERVENFAVLRDGVLFVGLHLVSGQIPDQEQWNTIVEDNLRFFFGMLNMHKGQFRSLAIFGSARPNPQHEVFFDGLMELVEDLDLPIAYIHASPFDNDEEKEYTPFENHEKILAIQADADGSLPPVRVTVGFGSTPFVVG